MQQSEPRAAAIGLTGSPRQFRFRPPDGFLDFIAEGYANGWSVDPDVPSQSNQVHFYIDGPAGPGNFIGLVTTTVPRPDVPYPGVHGFKFYIPDQYRDGQTHTLYAYGIDLTGNPPKLLNGVPKTFNLSFNVTSVNFEELAPATGYSIPLGNNPLNDEDNGTDEGLRVFPDKDLPDETVDRQTIRVKAAINGAVAGKTVYFRNFDMDDPSIFSTVDPDREGNDNNGDVGGNKAGRLFRQRGCQLIANGIACPTDSNGVAFADFTVTMQPGDAVGAFVANAKSLNLYEFIYPDCI